jgi:hypothetical protein
MKQMLRTIVLLLFAANTANAQHDHSSHDHGSTNAEHSHKSEPPHGGEIKDVGKYHLEIVFDAMVTSENMNIYILKSSLKILDSKDATGSLNVKYKNGLEENYELINNSVDKLYCNIKDAINGFNAIIKITYKGKEYGCAYSYNGMK